MAMHHRVSRIHPRARRQCKVVSRYWRDGAIVQCDVVERLACRSDKEKASHQPPSPHLVSAIFHLRVDPEAAAIRTID